MRGPGLFDVTGDDVYVRYKEKSSAEQALIELVGRYDSLCLAPPSDIQADKFGYYTITFVNDKCLSKSDVWYIFSKVRGSPVRNFWIIILPSFSSELWPVLTERLTARKEESSCLTKRSREL